MSNNLVTEFLSSKDGHPTCKINSIFLHSAYSPLKEAERFANTIQVPFIPDILFIIEPGFSYCVPYLKTRFPNTKIAAIRLTDYFKESDSFFDFVFYLKNYKSIFDFENFIFSKFGENTLSFSFLQFWEPSSRIFKDEFIEIYNSYKNLINKCHSILRTRSFFEKRWITNTVNFIKNNKNNLSLNKKGNKPVVICASGPSLKDILPFLEENKKLKKDFILIAVSSALLPLVSRGIIPDFCISTDGGFWAKKHIEILRHFPEIKFGLAVEGNCPSKLLKNTTIIPLSYSDGIESELFNFSGFTSLKILRCGTVSGTALDFAKKISSGDIYFSGLDLHLTKGYQHTQKNELELSASIKDFKISSREKRTCNQGFSKQSVSLKIYEDWFASLEKDNSRKIFRVINKPQNNLGNIKDISSKDFISKCITFPQAGIDPDFSITNVNVNEAQKKALSFLKSRSKDTNWLSNIFVSEYLNVTHSIDENKKEALMKDILSKNELLLDKLCRPFTKK